MDRRDTLRALLALGVVIRPLCVGAQQPGNLRRIGWLTPSVSSAAQSGQNLIRELFGRIGYAEGKNIAVEWRYADGHFERLPAMASELVRQGVELIVATTNDACIAAMGATRALPIVLNAGSNPVEMGFVKSLARPGGNVTGTIYNSPETAGKVLQVLKETAPRVRRVAIILNTAIAGMNYFIDDTDRAAKSLGIALQYYKIARDEDVGNALERIDRHPVDAFIVGGGSNYVATHLKEITAFAIKHKLPSIGVTVNVVEAGGLLYYGPDLAKIVERTLYYVDRILRGAKPSDLPIELPSKFELVINARTARALKIKLPPTILARADRVIE